MTPAKVTESHSDAQLKRCSTMCWFLYVCVYERLKLVIFEWNLALHLADDGSFGGHWWVWISLRSLNSDGFYFLFLFFFGWKFLDLVEYFSI